MKWKGPDEGDDDDDEEEEEEEDLTEEATGFEGEEGAVPKRKKKKFDKDNKCDLVWTGLATKRQFKGFVFQHCETSDQARKVLKSKGVEYYWDQILSHASGRGDSLHLKLVDDDDEDNNVFNEKSHDGIDVVMTDA
jgi:U4/U6 small nuclear ribonucleoprotein PRP3